ncbi:MAG TPA: hypothetical protein VFQ53_36000 [Kofleriaceae bacterium]|nr:hypothetical protein [Kofleriaceae bacterium]
MDLERQIARLVRVLGRKIELVKRDALPNAPGDLCRIEQTCPLCDVALGIMFVLRDDTTARWLHRELFAVYDDHHCATSAISAEQAYERAERESVRCGERVIALQATATADDALLVERAERESIKMAERAQALRRQL